MTTSSVQLVPPHRYATDAELAMIRRGMTQIEVTLDPAEIQATFDRILEGDRYRHDLASTSPEVCLRFHEAVVRRYLEFLTSACPNAAVTVAVGPAYRVQMWGEQPAHFEVDGEEAWIVIQQADQDAWDRVKLDAYSEAFGAKLP